MRQILDTVWQRRGTSWIWDEDARNLVCDASEVWSLRKFLQAAGNWPDDVPSNRNRTLVVAGLDGSLDLLTPDDATLWLGDSIKSAILSFQDEYEGNAALLVCTAAGREGINLQFARILFNFDLPWNPMDIEQRIGRIHRYGQNHTAQIYNLVLSDTIEGRIYLLLDEKLTEIARAVGKVDDQGNVAEDLRAQILGQLSERLNYDRLYQEAISDPELKRTQVELEAALSNSREARQVVFDLFQDLDGFSLDDYKPFSDVSSSISRLVRFFSSAVAERQQKLVKADDETYDLMSLNSERFSRFTINRDVAADHRDWELMGIDHALVQRELDLWRGLSPEEIGISVSGDIDTLVLLSIWVVEVSSGNGERRIIVQPIAVRQDGTRVPSAERQFDQYFHSQSTRPKLTLEQRIELFSSAIEPTLQRELKHKGVSCGDESYSAELIGCIEIVNSKE